MTARRCAATLARISLGSILAFPMNAPSAATAPDRIVPTVVSTPGASGAMWRTMLMAYNPSSSACRTELVFHPAGQEGKDTDPAATLSLSAGEARTVTDLLRDELRLTSVSGSLDVRATEGTLPVLVVQVYNEGQGGGTQGLSVPVVAPGEALVAGDRAVLLVPASGSFRFNVGARSVGGPASLTVTVRDARGLVRSTSTRSLGANLFVQQAAADFAGGPVLPGDAIQLDVTSGALLVYGTPVDNVTNDGSYQAAEKVSVPGPDVELTNDFTPPTGRDGNAQEGPGASRLMTATSPDGLAFTRTNLVISDQADVPEMITDSRGWVYAYYICWTVGNEHNKLVVAISRDKGRTWIYKKLVVSGFEGMSDPVDPDVQLLPDGTFRLYVTSAEGADWSKARTYYAEGTDGIRFTKKGVSFAPPLGVALDPSTVKLGSTWHYFSGGEPGSNRHATSSDGKTFTYDGELVVRSQEGVTQLMANGIPVAGGVRFYTFDSVPASPTQPQSLGSVFSADGRTWISEPGRRLTLDPSNGKESRHLKDPAAVRLLDGTYLLVYSTRIP